VIDTYLERCVVAGPQRRRLASEVGGARRRLTVHLLDDVALQQAGRLLR
jgi:hypothetical protein